MGQSKQGDNPPICFPNFFGWFIEPFFLTSGRIELSCAGENKDVRDLAIEYGLE